MVIGEWLQTASLALKGSGAESARLDALMLLEYITKRTRAELLAHPQDALTDDASSELAKAIKLRQHHYPMAYITGAKEFYGRKFVVTPDVLIPRPETEDLVATAIKLIPHNTRILELGTGSGCIAITLACERPDLVVTAADISKAALDVAKLNAKSINVGVNFVETNLFSAWEKQVQNPHWHRFDAVIANLPYVPAKIHRTKANHKSIKHEPKQALYSGINGLKLYRKFFKQLPMYLNKRGLVIIEALPSQHSALANIAKRHSFKLLGEKNYILAFIHR